MVENTTAGLTHQTSQDKNTAKVKASSKHTLFLVLFVGILFVDLGILSFFAYLIHEAYAGGSGPADVSPILFPIALLFVSVAGIPAAIISVVLGRLALKRPAGANTGGYIGPTLTLTDQVAHVEPSPSFNVLALISFVAAFVFAPAGLIGGIAALILIHRRYQKGGGLAIAAIIISFLFTIISAVFLIH